MTLYDRMGILPTIMNALKKHLPRNPAGKLFLLCFLAYMFSYFGRYDFSACQKAMINEGILDLASASTVASAYFICYGLGQLLNGALGVRVSPKYMIGTGLFGVGLCNILMGVCPWRIGLTLIWAANGYFNSMLWSPIIRAFSEWMDAPTRERAGANISLTIPLGTMSSYIIPSVALAFGSWRAVFFISGGLIILCGTVWFLGLSSISDYTSSMSAAAEAERLSVSGDAKKAPHLTLAVWFGTGLMLTACAAIFNGALKEAVMQWFPQYLTEDFGISEARASLISAILPIPGIAGPYIAVWLDKKLIHNECLTAASLYGVSFISMLALVLFGRYHAVSAIICVALSIAAMWGINTILLTYVSYHYGKMGISSAVSGTINSFVYIGSTVGTSVYGRAAAAAGWNTTLIIWCVTAAAAVAVSVIAGISWRRRQPKY